MSKFTVIALVLGGAVSAASAQTVSQWDVLGAPGDQAFTVGAGATGITASNLTRGAGLTPSTGGNSINSTSWNGPNDNDFYTFGFTAQPGVTVDLDDLYIGSRSSNTGPGFLGLFSSLDGFAANLFTFTMDFANFRNDIIDLSALPNITGAVEFRIRSLNNVAANGGVVGAGGSYRLTGYFAGGIFDRNMQFTGIVVPTPGALGLLGLAGLVATRRRRA